MNMSKRYAVRTYQEIIRKSAILLDSEHPGWEKLIVINSLDMGSVYNCIRGQLNSKTNTYASTCNAKRGFTVDGWIGNTDANETNRILKRIWVHQINKRLKAIKVA